jgi:hypothetical protein
VGPQGRLPHRRRKDSSGSVEFAIHFREFAGTYMEHCHNTQHEDNSMLLRWDIEYPGQFQVMPTPLPTWDGVEYAPPVGIPTFRTGARARCDACRERPSRACAVFEVQQSSDA